MYDILVPVISNNVKRMGRETIVSEMNRIGSNRIFIATGTFQYEKQNREATLETLKENCTYFKEKGFETNTWNWSFWVDGNHPFTKMKHYNGYLQESFCCPSDEAFLAFVRDYIKDLAKTGAKMILMDDDFRLSANCICDNHKKLIEELVGEQLTIEQLKQKIFSGGKNKYRDAFRKVNATLLTNYAKMLREAVDEVNPKIRIGLCAVMSLWDIDGVDAATISKILAGKTKPYLRLIGAPYWGVNKFLGNRLQDTFELLRMERSWCGDFDGEIVAEGDVYPRPRHATPASYVELYDLAVRADGKLNGIMKYALDYYASPRYETGYVDTHCKNKELYSKVEELFGGKESVGVRVYESMNKFSTMTVPKQMEGDPKFVDSFFPVAARMLAQTSVPTTYYGEGVCGIAFGENVKMVPREAFKKGMILDVEAARLLEEQGIDVGLVSVGKTVNVIEENFETQNEYALGSYQAHLIELKEGAKADSFICYYDDETSSMQQSPCAYYYENKEGEQFFVFAFEGYFNSDTMYRSYARSKQLEQAVKAFFGNNLPAYSYGNPDLYLMCKVQDGAMAVGLWNCFADGIETPVITLDKEYSEIRFINCEGKLEGNQVTLSYMEPFSFGAFEVK